MAVRLLLLPEPDCKLTGAIVQMVVRALHSSYQFISDSQRVQASVMIYTYSFPLTLPSLVPFPPFLHVNGCSLDEPLIFKLLWFVVVFRGNLHIVLTPSTRMPTLLFESKPVRC